MFLLDLTHFMNRIYEAVAIWHAVFEQSLDRGDYAGIREVDEHFGLIGNIKEAF